MNKLMTIGMIALLVFLGACVSNQQNENNATNQARVISSAGEYTINIEIADEPAELQQGLMFRPVLAEDSGMLFIFKNSAKQSFWMKNTLIPLDIIFISKDKRIINIKYAVPCVSEFCPSYFSDGDAQYVLEVNGNYTKELGIKAGDRVEF